MHPAFITAIAAAQRQDKLARAAASRRARQARQNRPARPGSQPEVSPRHMVRRQHGPAGPLCPAVPSTPERQKVGA
jgi:hypothetical protein